MQDRDTAVNLHFGISRKDGNRDDVQVLYDNNFIVNQIPNSTNDQGGVAQGSYTTATTMRYNKSGIRFSGNVGWLVDSTNPLNADRDRRFVPRLQRGTRLGRPLTYAGFARATGDGKNPRSRVRKQPCNRP